MEKKIKEDFLDNKTREEGWSTYSCFAEAIREKKVPRDIVEKLFNSLVHKKDYIGVPKEIIIDNLMKITQEQ